MGVQTMIPVPKEDIPGNLVPASDLPKNFRTKEPDISTPKEKSGMEAITSTIPSGYIGGLFAPEAMETAGVGVTALGKALGTMPGYPGMIGKAAQVVGPTITAGGEALRGSRMASGLGGAFTAVAGESTAQAAKGMGAGPVGEETARILGATIAPLPFQMFGSTIGKVVGMLPSMRAARTFGEFLQEKGITAAEVEKLSSANKKFLQEKASELRAGGERSRAAEIEIANLFKTQAKNINEIAEQRASALESEAEKIIKEATDAGGRITADMDKRIANLRSQFDSAADTLRSNAQGEARLRIEAGAKRAAIIRKNAENQSASVRQLAENDAQAAIFSAQQQADQLLIDSEIKIATSQIRIENQQRRLAEFKSKYDPFRSAQGGLLGDPILPTNLGKEIRTSFDRRLTDLNKAREDLSKPFRDKWKQNVSSQEEKGITYRNTPAYDEALNAIQAEKVDPKTGFVRVTDSKASGQIDNLLKQINPVERQVNEAGQAIEVPIKVSADALEITLRRLKDRASGLPAEGVDAIDQQLAGRLAKNVEKILDEFSGKSYLAYKDAYKKGSEPINQFLSRLGAKVTGKPEGFNVGDYLERLPELGQSTFRSAVTVDQLLTVAGKEEANRLAKGFLADQIGKPTPGKIEQVLNSNRDWLALEEFKNLRKSLETAASNLKKADTQESRIDILQKALGVRMTNLPQAPRRAAESISAKGQVAAQRKMAEGESAVRGIEKRTEEKVKKFTPELQDIRQQQEAQITSGAKSVERRAEDLRKEASTKAEELRKTGEKVAEPLTKEAAAIRDEAQKKAQTLLADTTDESMFERIVLGSKDSEWQAMGEAIRSAPGGKEKFADAVSQLIARKAERSLSGARDTMESMGERAVNYGLMDRNAVEALKSKLNEIYVAPISLKEKTSMISRLVKNAITGYAYPAVGRAGAAFGEATK